jgi:hypothetical protein
LVVVVVVVDLLAAARQRAVAWAVAQASLG